MTDLQPIPPPREPISGQGGFLVRTWWRWLKNQNTVLSGLANENGSADSGTGQLNAIAASLEDRLREVERRLTVVPEGESRRVIENSPVVFEGRRSIESPSQAQLASLEVRLRAVEHRLSEAGTMPRLTIDDVMKLIQPTRPDLLNGVAVVNFISDAGADVGTLTNAPTAGNPAFWLRLSIDGAQYAVPCWLA